jgi:cytochrome c-type biogenesis protein CcmF
VLEQAVLGVAVAVALTGALRPAWERTAAAVVAATLLAAIAALTVHLLTDDFAYRYVWLYSGATLAWPYKLANLWGGDEGTLLVLATLTAFAARTLSRSGDWAGRGSLLLAALFAAGALIWNPFAATPAAELARLEARGMNAHLVSPWMLVHPPLVFTAYMLLLAPAGSAAQALASGEGRWGAIARRSVRSAWLVLSGGLAFGMWWAYQDFTFGQFWHWDPVQTSVFVVWAFTTAHMHCLQRYQAGAFARVHPILGLLSAAAVLASLGVTRSAMLASSHRYVGDTSLPVYLVGAGALIAVLLWAAARSRRWQPPPRRKAADEYGFLIWIAVAAFCAAGLIAAGHLVEAYASAYLGLPRPTFLKPFFETLARWSAGDEIAKLRRAFDQWDVDNFGAYRWLTPVGVAVGLFGGHAFVPIRRQWRRWALTATVALAALITALQVHPTAELFTGKGLTSRNTVAIFPWIDALIVTMAYLGVAVLAGIVAALARFRLRSLVLRFYTPVALIHLGAVLALSGGTVAMVLDSYSQKMLDYPDDFGTPIALPGGYSVSVRLDGEDVTEDGLRSDRGTGFHAVAEVGWRLERDGKVIEDSSGHPLYRDDRTPVKGLNSPVRLMCEIVDYRYARYVSDGRHMIHPLIHRGLWRDVQLWFPAIDYQEAAAAAASAELAGLRRRNQAPVVLKVYPLVSWLWIGLVLILVGALGRAVIEGRRPYRPPPPPNRGIRSRA